MVVTTGFAVGLDDRDTPVGSEELCDLTYELYAYVIRAFGPGERRRLPSFVLNGRGRLTMLASRAVHVREQLPRGQGMYLLQNAMESF